MERSIAKAQALWPEITAVRLHVMANNAAVRFYGAPPLTHTPAVFCASRLLFRCSCFLRKSERGGGSAERAGFEVGATKQDYPPGYTAYRMVKTL